MAGISLTGWGAPIAGAWFVIDLGTELIIGISLLDRIDDTVGSPLLEW